MICTLIRDYGWSWRQKVIRLTASLTMVCWGCCLDYRWSCGDDKVVNVMTFACETKRSSDWLLRWQWCVWSCCLDCLWSCGHDKLVNVVRFTCETKRSSDWLHRWQWVEWRQNSHCDDICISCTCTWPNSMWYVFNSIMVLVKFLTSANQKHRIWSCDESWLCNHDPVSLETRS